MIQCHAPYALSLPGVSGALHPEPGQGMGRGRLPFLIGPKSCQFNEAHPQSLVMDTLLQKSIQRKTLHASGSQLYSCVALPENRLYPHIDRDLVWHSRFRQDGFVHRPVPSNPQVPGNLPYLLYHFSLSPFCTLLNLQVKPVLPLYPSQSGDKITNANLSHPLCQYTLPTIWMSEYLERPVQQAMLMHMT